MIVIAGVCVCGRGRGSNFGPGLKRSELFDSSLRGFDHCQSHLLWEVKHVGAEVVSDFFIAAPCVLCSGEQSDFVWDEQQNVLGEDRDGRRERYVPPSTCAVPCLWVIIQNPMDRVEFVTLWMFPFYSKLSRAKEDIKSVCCS